MKMNLGLGLGLGGTHGGGGSTPFVQNVPMVAIVASRGMIPAIANPVSGDTNDMSAWRVRHRIGRFPATKLRPAFVSAVLDATGASWARQPQDLPIKWALDTGATNWKLGDDVVLPSSGRVVPTTQVVAADLGLGSIGAGANIFSRGEVTLAAGQTVYGGQARSITTTNSAENVLRSQGQASQTNQAGDLSVTNRNALVYGFSPQMILGEWVSARDLSVLVLGDSIFWGANDGSSASTQLHEGFTGGGMAARGLYAVGGANKTVPWAKVALGGQRAQRAVEATAKAILADYAPYATDVLCNYFYNDRQSASRTATEILADLIELGRYLNSLGLRFHWTTPIPATSSSDSWATLANQSVNAGYAADAATVTAGMTAAFAAGYAAGGITGGIIDVRAALVDSVETDKWIANGSAYYAVGSASDTVHPTATGYALAAAPIAAYFNALSIPV